MNKIGRKPLYVSNHFPLSMDIEFMCMTIHEVTGLRYFEFLSQPADKSAWKPMLFFSHAGEIVYDKIILWECEGVVEEGKRQD